jgi:hypothetical protein
MKLKEIQKILRRVHPNDSLVYRWLCRGLVHNQPYSIESKNDIWKLVSRRYFKLHTKFWLHMLFSIWLLVMAIYSLVELIQRCNELHSHNGLTLFIFAMLFIVSALFSVSLLRKLPVICKDLQLLKDDVNEIPKIRLNARRLRKMLQIYKAGTCVHDLTQIALAKLADLEHRQIREERGGLPRSFMALRLISGIKQDRAELVVLLTDFLLVRCISFIPNNPREEYERDPDWWKTGQT